MFKNVDRVTRNFRVTCIGLIAIGFVILGTVNCWK